MNQNGNAGHCCMCSTVCHHASPPVYCRTHLGIAEEVSARYQYTTQLPPVPPVPATALAIIHAKLEEILTLLKTKEEKK